MTHRLATNYAKNYCIRTPIVNVIVEYVVTCFLGHSVDNLLTYLLAYLRINKQRDSAKQTRRAARVIKVLQ